LEANRDTPLTFKTPSPAGYEQLRSQLQNDLHPVVVIEGPQQPLQLLLNLLQRRSDVTTTVLELGSKNELDDQRVLFDLGKTAETLPLADAPTGAIDEKAVTENELYLLFRVEPTAAAPAIERNE
jgi:hypothetical protein